MCHCDERSEEAIRPKVVLNEVKDPSFHSGRLFESDCFANARNDKGEYKNETR